MFTLPATNQKRCSDIADSPLQREKGRWKLVVILPVSLSGLTLMMISRIRVRRRLAKPRRILHVPTAAMRGLLLVPKALHAASRALASFQILATTQTTKQIRIWRRFR